MLLRRRASLRRAPSQARSSFTFESILEAAEQLILGGGVQAVHMSSLATKAGVSAGTLYQYFPDKSSVLMALADRICARFVEAVTHAFAVASSASLDAFLEHVSGAVAELACREHGLKSALRGALEKGGEGGEPVDLSEKATDFLTAALREKVPLPEAQLQQMCRSMVWAADGLVEGALRGASVSVSDVARTLLAAWQGLLSGARP